MSLIRVPSTYSIQYDDHFIVIIFRWSKEYWRSIYFYHTAQQAHTGEKPYKSAEMVVIPRFCLKLLHTTINIKTTTYWHHVRWPEVHRTSDRRTWCQYDVVLSLNIFGRMPRGIKQHTDLCMTRTCQVECIENRKNSHLKVVHVELWVDIWQALPMSDQVRSWLTAITQLNC